MVPIKTKKGRLLSTTFVRGFGKNVKMHNKEHAEAQKRMDKIERKKILGKKAEPKGKQTLITRMKSIQRVIEKHFEAGKKIDAQRQAFLLRQLRNIGERISQTNGSTLPERLKLIKLVATRAPLIKEIKKLEGKGLVRTKFTKEAKKALYPKQNAK